MVHLHFEKTLWEQGIMHIAGVDEAGRGPLAGPVVAAAVFFPKDVIIDGVNDSKKLSEVKREELFEQIHRAALSIGVGIVGHETIDSINILQATLNAMEEAVLHLSPSPQHLLIDGNQFRKNGIPHTTIIDGDAKCFSIAAASIVAKVTRDRIMLKYDEQFPQYGFAKHKGYGTKAHLEAIRAHGFCEIHRRSFRTSAVQK